MDLWKISWGSDERHTVDRSHGRVWTKNEWVERSGEVLLGFGEVWRRKKKRKRWGRNTSFLGLIGVAGVQNDRSYGRKCPHGTPYFIRFNLPLPVCRWNDRWNGRQRPYRMSSFVLFFLCFWSRMSNDRSNGRVRPFGTPSNALESLMVSAENQNDRRNERVHPFDKPSFTLLPLVVLCWNLLQVKRPPARPLWSLERPSFDLFLLKLVFFFIFPWC
jgi:hypothetical protein